MPATLTAPPVFPLDLATCRAVADALATTATPLFPGWECGDTPAPAPDAPAGYWLHTAARIDEQRQLMVGALRLLGWSDRRIADQLKLSRNCIGPICRKLEKEGRLEPLRARLTQQVGEVLEQAVLGAREMIEAISPRDPDKDVAGALKALTDAAYKFGQQHALLTGSPTEISARITAAAPARSAWDEFLRAHQVVEVPSTPDTKSGADRSESTGCIELTGCDTRSITSATAVEVGQSGRPDTAAAEAPTGAPPGGGLASISDPSDPDPKSASKFMGRSEPPAQAPTLP